MSLPNPRIEKFRGDTWRIVVEVIEQDLAGATFASQARFADHDEEVQVLDFTCTQGIENAQEVICVADAAQTQSAAAGDWLWDMQITSADGVVTTVARATIVCLKDVTRV